MAEHPPPSDDIRDTGIDVIVVGAGFAGIACAVECKRKGHRVMILEKVHELKQLGDMLSLGVNASRILARWGLHEKLWGVADSAGEIHIHDYLGDLVQVQKMSYPLFGAFPYNGHRAVIHEVLFEHAKSLGIEIRMGHQAVEYWEDEANGKAGVKIQTGETFDADVIVAADGVKSLARKFVIGYCDNPKPSGYAIYRAWFDAEEHGITTDPLTDFLSVHGNQVHAWIGGDMHFLAISSQGGKTICFFLTHKDNAAVDGDWSSPGKIEDVLDLLKDRDPRCAAIVSKAPSCIDWKLLVHDPLPTWVSKSGRVVLIGDAAHPFLPTSVQGASQAIEDGVTLAVSLNLAGKDNVRLGTRTWECMRYQRVHDAQMLGVTTRNLWHGAKAGDSGNKFELPMPEWLMAFDAEAHAYAAYDGIARTIVEEGYRLPSLEEVKESPGYLGRIACGAGRANLKGLLYLDENLIRIYIT
ncbi:monooxygenase [Suillus bovinus]|uniref:monooxygenase n=1 Tax=Suillus bovinus TaxID=48563 RepID=UPI001B88224B|nr:monooxygenase [Suillus bovinus]KAG2136073.1 monooxygenase [Suillus bovinus]